jgi:protocatechuate 3,4-dioxygenase beta subunit
LHDNFQLKLVFDKKNQAIIDYTVEIWQGDNMAGLLFLF